MRFCHFNKESGTRDDSGWCSVFLSDPIEWERFLFSSHTAVFEKSRQISVTVTPTVTIWKNWTFRSACSSNTSHTCYTCWDFRSYCWQNSQKQKTVGDGTFHTTFISEKKIISDESDDDDVRILESALTAGDQQTKPRKLTPEEANSRMLTDGLAFYFNSLEIKVNQL